MESISKRPALFILGLTAIVCSRIMFVFFNDPEGPNLLVVGVLAAIVYLVSLGVYFYMPLTTTGFKKALLTVAAQILLVVVLYFVLR